MPEPRIQTPASPLGVNTPRLPAPIPAVGRGATVSPDQARLTPTVKPQVEADVRLALQGGTAAAADGTVTVQPAFIARFIERLMTDRRTFPEMKVTFDPAQRAFVITGKARWHGLTLPTVVTARPAVVNGQVGMRFDAPALRVGSLNIKAGALTGLATQLVLTRLQSTLVQAHAGATAGFVAFDPASVLHSTGALPTYLTLDMKRTSLAVETGATGEVKLHLTAAGVPAAALSTPASDVSLALDDAAVQAILRHAAGADYAVSGLRLRESGATVHGLANAKPISDTLTLAKSLLLLAAIHNGQPTSRLNGDAVVVKTELELDLKLEGRIVTITPSISLACAEMLKTLTAAGVPATREGKSIRMDVDAAAAVLGADLRRLQVNPHGVALEMGVDLDVLLKR